MPHLLNITKNLDISIRRIFPNPEIATRRQVYSLFRISSMLLRVLCKFLELVLLKKLLNLRNKTWRNMKSKITVFFILFLVSTSCAPNYRYKNTDFDTQNHVYKDYKLNYSIALKGNCNFIDSEKLPFDHEIYSVIDGVILGESKLLIDDDNDISFLYTVKKGTVEHKKWVYTVLAILLANEEKKKEIGEMYRKAFKLKRTPSEYQVHGRSLIAFFTPRESSSYRVGLVMQQFEDFENAKKGNLLIGVLSLPKELIMSGKDSKVRGFLDQFKFTAFNIEERTISSKN